MAKKNRRKFFQFTHEQHEKRRQYIGGSDANILMNGDAAEINTLWRVKRGVEPPEDLSDILPVCMGTITEPLNIYWFELNTGKVVSREGQHVVSKKKGFMASTLDGFIAKEKAVFEAKHTNGFQPLENIVQKYMPQLYHNMFVNEVDTSYISVLLGTMKWATKQVDLDDPFYLEQLLEREEYFWECVQQNKEPALEPVEAPVIPMSDMRVVDMTGNNSWAVAAADWIETKPHAEKNTAMAKELRDMVEGDVREASGHGVIIKRDRAGKLRLQEQNDG